ncbi:hypothetical protein SCHPADRAFT_930337 [Schizopora paradoxa]|uniref:F-box domain-containing protein n=1 Tax=Schizopora paradoxa TaxID=27342 RepID=A0A0H2RMW5_9AGAM|nr:hypothetical protein SCHPADRAFT_930337 [Schizopora paradoxa]
MAQTLPEDVLYAIFFHALPSKFVLMTIEPSNKPWMVPPLTFSLVCRSWRLLVLSRPNLWSKISFESRIESGKDYRDPRIKPALIQWLSRSSSSPLWIDLEVDGDISGYVPDEILPLFLQECHRWSTVHINVESGVRFARERNPTTFTIRCLAPLTFFSAKLVGSRSPVACIDLSHNIASNYAHLEQLSIGVGTTVCLPQIRDALRLPHLRSLYYRTLGRGRTLESLQCILSASPNLEILEIENPPILPILTPGSVLLPRLRSLSLGTTASYLDLLSCPFLREFTYDIEFPRDLERTEDRAILELQRIRDFLLRAQASPALPLEILKLGWLEVKGIVNLNHATALKELLVQLKSLKTLVLHDYALNRAVIEMLTVPTEGPLEAILCPSLCAITLGDSYPNQHRDFTEEMMEELIVSRWKAGRLRTVTLSFLWLISGAILFRRRISEYIKEGLEVNTDIMYFRARHAR